jgi:hypothetical protein
MRLVMAGCIAACVTGLVGAALPAPAFACENERFRTGPSASLPDCRAYELVTPENLGRTQSLTFTLGNDHAIPSSDGEHLALETGAPFEPNSHTSAGIGGTHAVFSRTAAGWVMKSATGEGMSADTLRASLFSPDFSQVALESETALNSEPVPITLKVGPVGGPYLPLATVSGRESLEALGANNGTASVPAFSDVVFESNDHVLLPPGPERKLAEETLPGEPDLYECRVAASSCELVNVEGERLNLKLVNRCYATLGEGTRAGDTINAVSADGSKVFFKTRQSGENCEGPSRLYMRVDGRETVEVSAFQGVPESGRQDVIYEGATADGSVVFFATGTALTTNAPANGNKLYEYDTEAPVGQRLTLITSEFIGHEEVSSSRFVSSEDGSIVYVDAGSNVIVRWEKVTGTSTWRSTPVAQATETPTEEEPSQTTPDGEFLLFASWGHNVGDLEEREGVKGEPRGAGVPGYSHNELYRYDNVDKSVMCVSCGEGTVPEKGTTLEPLRDNTLLEPADGTPTLISMSEDGRRVFFRTSAQLVAQDTNVDTPEEEESDGDLGQAADVYEWEADGTEEEPGVFCGVANGCTHLITSGEDVGPSIFLGASENGQNVFFATAAQLVPQATPEFDNIYDARVDGGFPSPPPASECLACQGVGSPPPLFNTPASGPFAGAGNPAVTVFGSGTKTKTKTKKPKKQHGKRRSRGRSKAVTGRGVRAKARGRGGRS